MTDILDQKGLEAARLAAANEAREYGLPEPIDAISDAAVSAYFSTVIPAETAAAVEKLRNLAAQIDPLLVGGKDAVLLREAATLIAAQAREIEGLRADKERIDAIRYLCGYVENGTDTKVTILQDDVTRSWLVRTGERSPLYFGSTLREAIDDARASINQSGTEGGKDG